MRKTHKKTCRNKRKTHKKTCRNKRKTQTRRRKGGVGTQGQAAHLQQDIEYLTGALTGQSHEAMEESIRGTRREDAKNMARTARIEHGREHGTRKSNLRQILGRNHLADPNLEEILLRESLDGPSQATLRSIRDKGTDVSRDNREAYDREEEAIHANHAAYMRAMTKRYGPSPPGGYGALPPPPFRSRAEEPTRFARFER